LNNIKSQIGEGSKANKMNKLLAYAKEMDETLYKKGKRRKRTPEQLLQRTFDSAKNNELKLNFSSFAPGTYFISLTADGERVTKKIIKEIALE
jgi:hypothetical protein